MFEDTRANEIGNCRETELAMKVAIYSHSIAPSIDGVCRRFTGLLQELSEQGHDLLLFTLESSPEDLPIKLTKWVTLDHMGIPSYPEKKIAMPTASSILRIWSALTAFKPDVRREQLSQHQQLTLFSCFFHAIELSYLSV